MATVKNTVLRDIGTGDGRATQHTWSPITSTNLDGDGVDVSDATEVCWVATGTWGTATLIIQGSADGTNWVTTGLSNLSSASPTEITATADKVFHTYERPRYVRPFLKVAGSGASLTVTAIVRRQPQRAG